MKKWWKTFNEKNDEWPQTVFEIILEIIVVYFVANLPFILLALDVPIVEEGRFLDAYSSVLQNQLYDGQLFTFVCALIAPVMFWSYIEKEKLIAGRLLSGLAAILVVMAAFLHEGSGSFARVSNFDLYLMALCVWIASILFRMIPPKHTPYPKIQKEDEDDFTKSTEGL